MKSNTISVAGKGIFFKTWEKLIKVKNMLRSNCNGTLMYSSESNVVRNDIFLSKLEQKLITLSDKYGLGDILFIERNPRNNNSFNAFIIKAPEEWSNQRIFDVWDPISDEVDIFAEEEGIECLAEICTVIVSNRYEV